MIYTAYRSLFGWWNQGRWAGHKQRTGERRAA